MDDGIVKEEHELLTFKMEADGALSLKNEIADDVSNIIDSDVMEKARSIKNDPDGNNWVDGRYDIVKEEHELTFKTEIDEALSFKEEISNLNDEESSDDCKTGTCDNVKEEIRNITYDTDGNNFVDGESPHMRTDTGERPFQCNMCEYRPVQKHLLISHMRGHNVKKAVRCNGEKLFQCYVCEYSAVQKQNLIKHVRTHTIERPFRCNVCKYHSFQKHHLISHMRTHTGEKPFQCHNCEYGAVQKRHLINHMRRHAVGKTASVQRLQFKTRSKRKFS